MTRKPISFVFTVIIVLGMLLGACTPDSQSTPEPTTPPQAVDTVEPTAEPTAVPEPTEEPEPAPMVFTDGLGRTIELLEPANAIVTLGPSILESLFAIGAGDQVIGREEFSTYPEEALEVTSVGSLWGELPIEAILVLEPDLVIAPEIISQEQVQALEDVGLVVFWQENPMDYWGLFANLAELGTLTGHESEASVLISSLAIRIAKVMKVIADADDSPLVFYELDATDPENPYTAGPGTFIDTIIQMSGGTNVGGVLEGGYAPLSSEEIIVANPEIILLADAPYGITPEIVAERAGWDVIAAVQNDMVLPFDPFLVSVPGPRMVDGLEMMAAALHPELFE